MQHLKRKIDKFLLDWKNDSDRLPLIISGASGVGKTSAVDYFGKNNYTNYIKINFLTEPQYTDIFDLSFNVDKIIKKISMHNPSLNFIPNETLIFFDEIQKCPNVLTSLKAFKIDGRYDVICTGFTAGINFKDVDSISVGYKMDYKMNSLDFEEFLWAKGYKKEQIEKLYTCMKECIPLSDVEFNVMTECFNEFMLLGGMPSIVSKFIENKNYSGILDMQKKMVKDYEDNIIKYASFYEKDKILNVYRNIPIFLANKNKKFQITKVKKGARNREYYEAINWLSNSGIVNICYSLDELCLPLKGNYNSSKYKLYFADSGLLIASLDNESQDDLRKNQNFNTCNYAIYENIVADMLVKEGYNLSFYKNEKGTLEIAFFVRDANSLIPVEVNSKKYATASLNNLIESDKYKDIKYGIKLCNKNIGFNGKFYTFPYFMTFLLKRFLLEKNDN